MLALAAFALPTVVMGALFSHLASQAAACGLGLGRALAVNTLGAALAPVLIGVGLLSAVGAKATLLMTVAAYALLALLTPAGPHGRARRPRAWPVAAWLPLSATGVLALVAPPLLHVSLPPGGTLVDHREGVLAAVSVIEDGQRVRRLHINNRQQEGSSHSLLADGRQVLSLLCRLLGVDRKKEGAAR